MSQKRFFMAYSVQVGSHRRFEQQFSAACFLWISDPNSEFLMAELRNIVCNGNNLDSDRADVSVSITAFNPVN